MIKDIFNQLFIIDKLKIDKEEMHHPYKHIIINKNNKIFLVDFERCHKTEKPKNVTQFCDYISSKYLKSILEKKNIKIDKNKMIGLSRNYKKNTSKENLKKIISYVR